MPHDQASGLGPLEVIMPALGMAQESGVIVAWHKKPGDAVAEGDVLFEVETDKATMEVEAQRSGYLSGVSAGDGDAVPVGQVIATIADSPDGAGDAPAASAAAKGDAGGAHSAPASDEALPSGTEVIMPTLGMAQDSGLLVNWCVEPGGKVVADDPLFEVETDKSTVEVPAGVDGYLAARLAEAGEDVPTGQVIAIVSDTAPASPVTRSAKSAPAPAASEPAATESDTARAAEKPTPERSAPTPPKASGPGAAPQPGGRILASPKARRLALEQGLDLQRLVEAGHPQPYHVKDLEVLKALPAETPATGGATTASARRLTAEIAEGGFDAFADWAAKEAGLKDRAALLAGLAGASLPRPDAVVAVESFGGTRVFAVPPGPLSGVVETEAAPDLILRDLRLSRLTTVAMGAEAAPVLTLTAQGGGVALTLECGAGQMTAPDAIACLSNVAGRLEDPLRHLL